MVSLERNETEIKLNTTQIFSFFAGWELISVDRTTVGTEQDFKVSKNYFTPIISLTENI